MSAVITKMPRTKSPAASTPDIITFVKDDRFLGLSISPAQETLLRGIFGLPLIADEQREIWALCTEREYTGQPFGEVMVISGARGGKDSRIAAPIVVYEAVFGAAGVFRLLGRSTRERRDVCPSPRPCPTHLGTSEILASKV